MKKQACFYLTTLYLIATILLFPAGIYWDTFFYLSFFVGGIPYMIFLWLGSLSEAIFSILGALWFLIFMINLVVWYIVAVKKRNYAPFIVLMASDLTVSMICVILRISGGSGLGYPEIGLLVRMCYFFAVMVFYRKEKEFVSLNQGKA